MIQCGMREGIKVRRQKITEKVKYFRYWGVRHFKWECPNIEVEKKKKREEEMVYVTRLQKVQQERRPVYPTWEKTQEYCKEKNVPPEGTLLLERRQITKETMAMYVDCRGCEGKRVQICKNQEQGFLLEKQVRNIWCDLCQEVWNWREREARREEMIRVEYVKCRRRDTIMRKVSEWKRKRILCPECRVGRKKEQQNWKETVYPTKRKAQQDSIQIEAPKGAVGGKNIERDVRRMFKILREVWLNIGVEKVDIHKGVTVKALLDSGVIGMFIDRKMAARYGFRLQKLERPIVVRNVNGTNNSIGAIIHQVEVNVYYKGHVKRMRLDVYDLGKTDVILEIPWLQAHNLEINWETGEVKMMRCPLLYGRNMKLKEESKVKKRKRVTTLEEKRIVRQVVDDKKDWGREKKVKVDYRKIKEMVPQKFLKQRKVFGKVESKRMPIRKIWDHAIDLKKMFKSKKGRIYPLSRNKREEVQNFIEDQLRKGYIRLSKLSQTSFRP